MRRNREYAETARSSATGDEKRIPRPVDTWQDVGCQARLHADAVLQGDGPDRAPDEEARDVQDTDRRGNRQRLVYRYDRIVNTIKSKYKRGTCNFNCLVTINCTVEGSRTFLDARLFLRGQSNSQTISELVAGCVQKGIRIRSLKMDREFFAVDVMNMLYKTGIAFTVPVIKTRGVKNTISEFMQSVRDAVSRHSIMSSDDSIAEFTLIILDKGDGKFHTFATNASVAEVLAYNSGTVKGAEGFAEEYRSRWGVETACKDYESARPRTTSRNEFVRILSLFVSMLMSNAWCLTNYLEQALRHAACITSRGLLKLFCKFILDPNQTAFPPDLQSASHRNGSRPAQRPPARAAHGP